MKRNLIIICTVFAWFGLQVGTAQVAQGNIDLQQVSSNPANPTGICQCDTIRVRYEIKAGANFTSTSTFRYQLANPINAWGSAIDLALVNLLTGINPDVNATNVNDTIGSGVKWADLAIPCNASLFGASLRIINEDINGNIVTDGASDTAYYNVNRIPTIAVIDSASMITQAGMRTDTFDNPYTTSTLDIGFCKGDTVILVVNNDGIRYQWFNGNTMVGTDADSLKVTASGQYYVEVFDGSCSIFSDTVAVNQLTTPTDITFNPNNSVGATQVDKPGNATLDSVEICETGSVFFTGPTPNPATGLTFTYQWLTDSLNPTSGLLDTFAIPGATNPSIIINSSNSRPGANRYWLVVDDGFCQDTTDVPYWVLVDTVPRAQVAGIPFPGFTGPTVFNEVCMKDSVNLTSLPTVVNGNWKFQWQWLDPSTTPNTWRPVWPAASSDPGLDTFPNITIDTSLSEPGQPYFQNPKSALRFFRVRINNITVNRNIQTCVFFSDSIAVRWFPEYSIALAPNQPAINIVGQDSINFCEDDTALVEAPQTPAGLLAFNFGYSYQWLTDSLDPLTGNRVRYAIPGATARQVPIDSSGNYFVVLDDGICTDTSDVFRVFVDTIPQTQVQEVPFPSGGGLSNLNLCLYDSALVSATDTVLGLNPWDYQWQIRNPGTGMWMDMTGETDVTLQIDTQSVPVGVDTGYVRLTTTYFNRFGLQVCDFITDSIMIIFFDSPTVSFIPGDSVGVCPGDSILFVAQGNFTSFSWQNGQVLSSSRYLGVPGDYPTVATGVNGCITRDTVTVFPLTVNAAAGPDQTVESGELVNLSASGGTGYRWFANKPLEFSDMLSQSISVRKVLDEGQEADTITIYVLVTNQRGCDGLDSLRLIVNRPDVPGSVDLIENAYNIFTPNGDGLNDVWDISEIVDGDNCRIQIMNRWGSTVFEDESFDGTWTGVDNGGNDVPDGTYYYVLDCNQEVRINNAITVIRNQ